jgi:hypothetical protein
MHEVDGKRLVTIKIEWARFVGHGGRFYVIQSRNLRTVVKRSWRAFDMRSRVKRTFGEDRAISMHDEVDGKRLVTIKIDWALFVLAMGRFHVNRQS